MENYIIVLFVLAIMILASGLADRIKVAAPIFLIIMGILIGFIPNLPNIVLNPEIVMLIFLPPLLYDAAFNISFQQFKTHIHTISVLSIGLVFVTTAGIACATYYFIPQMSWPLSFVLGSILAATDAVAAIGITKNLGLSHKIMTILEGESLVNDASSLVAYRLAVASVTGIAFVWWKGLISFAIVFVGGFAIGFVISFVLMYILKFFRKNDLVVISLMLIMPFVTYLIAEEFHVSGVIAVVMLGLGMSRLSRERFPERIKNQSRNFWGVNVFLLNGLIFILIGMQFPVVWNAIPKTQIYTYLSIAGVITLVAFGIRFLRIFWQQISLSKAFKGKRKVSEEALLDTKTSFIISWSGMRGIVSLAIALGLPQNLDNGVAFPMRNEIIFLTIAVVVFSLLVQGTTLPWIVKKLNDEKVI